MSREHVIQEPLGRAWSDELVRFPTPGPGLWRAVDVASGESLPSQVAEDGVWARVSLAPDQRLVLRLEPSALPAPQPFRIEEEPGFLVIHHGTFAVRVPSRGNFEARAMPGPVAALRRGNKWIGRGTFPFAGTVETTILSSGPLFARWITRYGERAAYEATLVAGEDFVRVRDTSETGDGLAFRFHIAAPTEWFTRGFGEDESVLRGPMERPPPRLGIAREGELAHVDFHSGHFQMSFTWMGLVAGGHAVGVSEWNGGEWKLPGRNRIRLLRAGDGVDFVFPANGGSKEFILACGDPGAFAPARGPSRFLHLRRKYSDLPLEKVRHWVLEAPLMPQDRPLLYPAGISFRTEGKLAEAWRRIEAPNAAAGLARYVVTGETAVRDRWLRQTGEDLDVAVAHALEGGYLRLNIFDARKLKVALEMVDVLRARGELGEATARAFARRAAFLAHCMADLNFWPWDSAFAREGDPSWMGREYFEDVGDSICPPNFWTEYYTAFALVGLAYPSHPCAAEWVARGEDLFARNLAAHFYDSGAYAESVNYHAHTVGMLIQFAVALCAAGGRDFFEHPRFRATFGFLADQQASPCRLTPAGRELATGRACLNPPRDERAALLVNWGNSGRDASGYLLPMSVAVAAGIYAERDPALARRLMSAWKASPQEFFTEFSALSLLAFGRFDLPIAEPAEGSRLFEGLGASMRSPGIFGWVKCGTATHHNCRDEGGLVLHAHGVPVIGDFGYHATHGGRVESSWQTWKHACVTFSGRDTSAYLGTERTLPPEHWESTPEYDLLVAHTPVEAIIPEGNPYLDVEQVSRIDHRRTLLFLKAVGCFVIYDHIPESRRPSTWWMHALADAVELSPQRARFRGRYGVDLDVQVLLPFPATFREGVYSVQRHIRIDQPGAGDYLTVVTPLASGSKPPEVGWDPVRRCLSVAGSRLAFDLVRRKVEPLS